MNERQTEKRKTENQTKNRRENCAITSRVALFHLLNSFQIIREKKTRWMHEEENNRKKGKDEREKDRNSLYPYTTSKCNNLGYCYLGYIQT